MEIIIINIRRSGRTTILFDDDNSYIGKTASFMETPCW